MSPPLASLRTELIVKFSVLTGTALLLAVASVLLLYDVLEPGHGALYLSTIVGIDVIVFIVYGAYQVEQLVVQPLRDAVNAAEAIAGGDLRRRVPDGNSRELRNLADSVNRMTDRLLEERAQLVRVEKLASIGRLAAGVAHEIGNPLGAINGYAHVLRSRLGDAASRPEVAELLAGLERESGRIDRIVRGLLDYARPRRATPTPVELDETIRSVVDLLSVQGALKDMDLRLEMADEPLRVHGDRHEIEQVFVNLLLNAADAVERRGRLVVRTERVSRTTLVAPAVRRSLGPTVQPIEHPASTRAQLWISDSDAEFAVKVVVADSGPGVPAELADRIFDPFYTTKPPGKGTGLGLAIVARIVDNLRGTIWVSPAREGGAAFHLLLPMSPSLSLGALPTVGAPTPTTGAPPTPSPTAPVR